VVIEKAYPMYCPVCDRKYDSEKSKKDTLDKVKKHVELQHPDYDPEWWDTNTDLDEEEMA